MFSAETYIRRREILKKRLGSGLVLLLGNSESSMNYADNTFPFRQDSTFLYFCGLNQPDLAAVIDLDDSNEVIFCDELTIDAIVWMGELPTVAERAAQVGIGTMAPRQALADVLSRATAAGRTVHYLPPYRPENKLWLKELLGSWDASSLDLIRAVVDQRSIKSAEEVAQMDEAVATSVDMHVAAMTMARPGMREWEISAEVERVALVPGHCHGARRGAAQPRTWRHTAAG